MKPDFRATVKLMVNLPLHADGEINRDGPMHSRLRTRLQIDHEQVRPWLGVNDLPPVVAGRSILCTIRLDVGFVGEIGWDGVDAEGPSETSKAGGGIEMLFRRFGVDARAGGIVGGDVAFTWLQPFGCRAFGVGHMESGSGTDIDGSITRCSCVIYL